VRDLPTPSFELQDGTITVVAKPRVRITLRSAEKTPDAGKMHVIALPFNAAGIESSDLARLRAFWKQQVDFGVTYDPSTRHLNIAPEPPRSGTGTVMVSLLKPFTLAKLQLVTDPDGLCTVVDLSSAQSRLLAQGKSTITLNHCDPGVVHAIEDEDQARTTCCDAFTFENIKRRSKGTITVMDKPGQPRIRLRDWMQIDLNGSPIRGPVRGPETFGLG
jgi:hypothetical protein